MRPTGTDTVTQDSIPDRIAVRLTDRERAAVASIAAAISHPHRSAPTVSEAIRAALMSAAASLTTSGLPR